MSPRNLGFKIATFFQRLVDPDKALGEFWIGREASAAFQDGQLRSVDGGKSCRIAFRNLSKVPLILCWITETGKLSHFYSLQPSLTVNVEIVSEGDHIETTQGGHAFCWVHVPEDKFQSIRDDKELPDVSCIVGGFRPVMDCGEDNPVLLVSISALGRHQQLKQQVEKEKTDACCFGPRGLRRRKRNVAALESLDDLDVFLPNLGDKDAWSAQVFLTELDDTPWDTTKKVYELKILGGWPVYCEPNWFGNRPEIEDRLIQDLREATKRLPRHSVEYLRRNCPIWVNSCIKFGPRVHPMTGRGLCYHPDRQWLIDNGLGDRKHLCIEINDGPEYTKYLDLWGPGGLLLHELSHAYHHRMIPGAYENEDIKHCFEAAMKEGLYDRVKVHGPQGPEARAYAATNCMEYFAELSAAFLGCKDDSEEYNKWYPFNRAQVKEHDPRAYNMLCRLWKINQKS